MIMSNVTAAPTMYTRKAKGGDSCVYSRKLCGRPPMLGVTVHSSKRARSGSLFHAGLSVVWWCKHA